MRPPIASTPPPQLVASLFLDEGDCLVAEQYCYPQFLECQLAPRRCTVLSAPCDERGLLPEALDALLAGAAAGGARPKLLYTVPTGVCVGGGGGGARVRRGAGRLAVGPTQPGTSGG
jgi:hypothetical protein